MTAPLTEWVATNLDLRHNQLINAAVETVEAPPEDPVKGQLWFDDVNKVLKHFNGTEWTGGASDYSQIADNNKLEPKRRILNFRSTKSIVAEVLDEGTQDRSSVQVAARFGKVRETLSSGEIHNDGTADTIARSDHSHGTPADQGSDSVLVSWWESDPGLWKQLVPTANFLDQLPGATIGGGWLMTAPGSVYWSGNMIPVAPEGIYRNSVRVSAMNTDSQVTVGWLCFDEEQNPLGRVRCINAASVPLANEAGSLVARNLIPEPSAEKPFTGETWHSDDVNGTGILCTVSRSAEQHSERAYSAKANWPAPAGAIRTSYMLVDSEEIPRNTKVTLSGRVFVPLGSPDVQLIAATYAASASVTLKEQWVPVEVQFTTAPDRDVQYSCGVVTYDTRSGGVAYVDQLMLRTGWNPLPGGYTYFDGNTTTTQTAAFAWEGEADNSTSDFYSLEPAWKTYTGYIATGDSMPLAAGDTATINQAASPPGGTMYFQPYVECSDGTLLVDTHEVARGTRNVSVPDGLETGWVEATGTVEAANLVAPDIAPPDTTPPTRLRVGPLHDPPQFAGDAVPRSYLDRMTGGGAALPPQFLWSGAPGATPIPADLGLAFEAWPLFSAWLDTGIKQAKTTVLTGGYYGSGSNPCPATAQWLAVPSTYRVVTVAPADGVMVGISGGTAATGGGDVTSLRCAGYSGVDQDGLGGTQQSYGFENHVHSPGGAWMGFCALSFVAVTAGVRYMFRTEYAGGGGNTHVLRDRTTVLYLPGAARFGS